MVKWIEFLLQSGAGTTETASGVEVLQLVPHQQTTVYKLMW